MLLLGYCCWCADAEYDADASSCYSHDSGILQTSQCVHWTTAAGDTHIHTVHNTLFLFRATPSGRQQSCLQATCSDTVSCRLVGDAAAIKFRPITVHVYDVQSCWLLWRYSAANQLSVSSSVMSLIHEGRNLFATKFQQDVNPRQRYYRCTLSFVFRNHVILHPLSSISIAFELRDTRPVGTVSQKWIRMFSCWS